MNILDRKRASRCLSAPNRRQDGSDDCFGLSPTYRSFNPLYRCDSFSPTKQITGLVLTRRRCFNSLNLNEILATVQQAWKSPKNLAADLDLNQSLNTLLAKMSDKHKRTTDTPSPILLRRRLSAPETIMRKHSLAQQRSASEDTEVFQRCETKTCQCGSEMGGGSYPNLSKRRDCNPMRKSTLLRRLWSNNRLSTGSRLSGSFYEWQQTFGKSLGSNQSSPEHFPKQKPSPKHNKFPSRSVDFGSREILSETKRSDQASSAYSSLTISTSTTTTTTISPKTVSTETSNFYSTTSSVSNSLSNRHSLETTTASIINNNSLKILSPRNESSTQTQDITNLNVISNIKLSDSTLDLIYNHVMKDLGKSPEQTKLDNTQLGNIEKVPSFFLKQTEDNSAQTKIVKYMISNVGTGGSYSKPPEAPQVIVPRYSALPRTTSMEVNTSSGDSEDVESETLSLVDSLEDPQSPHVDANFNHRYHEDEASLLLPDNSDRKHRIKEEKKSASFFIPMENNNDEQTKALTDLLPGKLRAKLAQRQQVREEKLQQHYRSSKPLQSSRFSVDFPFKKKIKPILPKLETMRKDERRSQEKQTKRKYLNEQTAQVTKQSSRQRFINQTEKLSPVYSNNESNPKHYQKSDYTKKRIEILEIMECIDTSETRQSHSSKSRIPVLVTKKSANRFPEKRIKPTFLDCDEDQSPDDHKFDQLIANILIDTLYQSDTVEACSNNNVKSANPKRIPKQQKKIEVIPEETQTTPDVENNNYDVRNKDRETVVLDRDKEQGTSTIPKGWITFYMLHKPDDPSDSNSDEGKKLELIQATLNEFLEANKHNTHNERKASAYKAAPSCGRHESPENTTVLPPITDLKKKDNRATNDWSVTLNGSSTHEKFLPNLEVTLKFNSNFNDKTDNSQSDSGLGDCEVLKKAKVTKTKRENKKDLFMFNKNNNSVQLPQIQQIRNTTVPRQRYPAPSIMEPRPTRTSTRRYYLSRPQNYTYGDLINHSNSFIAKHFPELLTIRGLSPDKEENTNEITHL